MKTKTFDILNSLDSANVAQLAHELHGACIIADEGDTCLSSTMMEGWDDACETLLRSHGYRGGPIGQAGRFFEGYGAIYCLFDLNALDYKEALRYLAGIRAQGVAKHLQ